MYGTIKQDTHTHTHTKVNNLIRLNDFSDMTQIARQSIIEKLLPPHSDLKVEALQYSETAVTSYHNTWCHILKTDFIVSTMKTSNLAHLKSNIQKMQHRLVNILHTFHDTEKVFYLPMSTHWKRIKLGDKNHCQFFL